MAGSLRNGAGIKVQIRGDGYVAVEARGGRLVVPKQPTSNENSGKTSSPNLDLYSSTVPKERGTNNLVI